ncbi:Sulfotransferase domain [Trinorchestia longiramus]|nr:Sulfotransferase domain [Trinorchestia longiramus]
MNSVNQVEIKFGTDFRTEHVGKNGGPIKRVAQQGNQNRNEPIAEHKNSKAENENQVPSKVLKLYDPDYGLLKSSFGGNPHLHSLSDLNKIMETYEPYPTKKFEPEKMEKEKPLNKTTKSSYNEFLSFFERGNAMKNVTKSALDSSTENTNKFAPQERERKVTEGTGINKVEFTQERHAPVSGTPRKPLPKPIILWTAWRSGSTFLGDLMSNANNYTFYSYEPLFHFGTQIFDDLENQDTKDALKLVEDLLACNALPHHDFLHKMYELKFPLLTNKKFYKECVPTKRCNDEVFFSDVCASSEVHVLKIIRLSLRFAASLLLKPKFKDLKIVYLARDPRPVISSRRQPVNLRWCPPTQPQCYDPLYACSLLSHDLNFIYTLQQQFPDRQVMLSLISISVSPNHHRFFFVRYEDLAAEPVRTVEWLWHKLGLPFTPAFSLYLQQTTSGHKPKMQVNDVTRDSAQHVFAWRSDITWKLVEEVQVACSTVITNFGWKLFHNEQDLRNLIMVSMRGVCMAALVVVLCGGAVCGSPLPSDTPADVPLEENRAPQTQDVETAVAYDAENANGANTTCADIETTSKPSDENPTTEKVADVGVDTEGEGGSNFEKRAAAEEPAEDSLEEDEVHILARRHGQHGDELKREENRRRKGSSEIEVPELVEVEENNNDEDAGTSTKKSQEESSTDSTLADYQDPASDLIVGEGPAEGGQVAALQSADAVPSEEKPETQIEGQETTVKSETGETIVPSNEEESSGEDASVGSEITDVRRRRRRVALKEGNGLEDKQQASNDTEQKIDESVKLVALT